MCDKAMLVFAHAFYIILNLKSICNISFTPSSFVYPVHPRKGLKLLRKDRKDSSQKEFCRASVMIFLILDKTQQILQCNLRSLIGRKRKL